MAQSGHECIIKIHVAERTWMHHQNTQGRAHMNASSKYTVQSAHERIIKIHGAERTWTHHQNTWCRAHMNASSKYMVQSTHEHIIKIHGAERTWMHHQNTWRRAHMNASSKYMVQSAHECIIKIHGAERTWTHHQNTRRRAHMNASSKYKAQSAHIKIQSASNTRCIVHTSTSNIIMIHRAQSTEHRARKSQCIKLSRHQDIMHIKVQNISQTREGIDMYICMWAFGKRTEKGKKNTHNDTMQPKTK
jgi:hypothetical protein